MNSVEVEQRMSKPTSATSSRLQSLVALSCAPFPGFAQTTVSERAAFMGRSPIPQVR